MIDIEELLNVVTFNQWLWQLGVLGLCLGAAYALARWSAKGTGADAESIWFGRRTVDGLLFPVLAIALVVAARWGMAHWQTTPVLRLALPILISLAVIRFFARVLSAVFPTSGVAVLVERFISWLAWIGAVLWITDLLPAVIDELDGVSMTFGKSHVTLRTLIEGVLWSGAVLVLTLWVSATIERRILRDAVSDLSMRKIVSNTTRAVLLFTGLLFVLSALGMDLTALSVLGGAMGVGLGLGLQKLAANYVSGFVILFERSLRIGDTVRVDAFEGVISDIKTRYTLIRAPNGRESVVPNEKLLTERIENLSLADPNIALTANVSVAYGSDVEQVQALLVEAALSRPRVLAQPAPAAYLNNLGDNGLEFTVVFWIGDMANGQLNVRSDVLIAMLKALDAAQIEIPYPQRVLRTVAPVPGVGADPGP